MIRQHFFLAHCCRCQSAARRGCLTPLQQTPAACRARSWQAALCRWRACSGCHSMLRLMQRLRAAPAAVAAHTPPLHSSHAMLHQATACWRCTPTPKPELGGGHGGCGSWRRQRRRSCAARSRRSCRGCTSGFGRGSGRRARHLGGCRCSLKPCLSSMLCDVQVCVHGNCVVHAKRQNLA